MAYTVQEILALVREKGIVAVDLRFMGLFGPWQHITISGESLSEQTFVDGVNCPARFPGWAFVWDRDLLIVPVPETAFIDPFSKQPTLAIVCDVVVPLPYSQGGKPSPFKALLQKVLKFFSSK